MLDRLDAARKFLADAVRRFSAAARVKFSVADKRVHRDGSGIRKSVRDLFFAKQRDATATIPMRMRTRRESSRSLSLATRQTCIVLADR